MPQAARAHLESLLQTHRLDRTLTSIRPEAPALERLATGLSDLDRHLEGGFPRGQLSELVGPVSSGRTSLLTRLLATTTAQDELAALVDGLDRFDPPSAAAGGVTLDHLLWIRGHLMSHPGFGRDLNQRALTQALEACALVLQSGSFALVALDLGGLPALALRRVPLTTWLRLQRMVEGSRTACVLLSETPIARSAAGLRVNLQPAGAGRWGDREYAAPRGEGQAEIEAPAALRARGHEKPRASIGVSSRRGEGQAETEAPAAMPSRGRANPRRGIGVSSAWGEAPLSTWLEECAAKSNGNAPAARFPRRGPTRTELMLTRHARLFEGLTIDVQAVHARTRWAEGSGCVVETDMKEVI